MAPAAASALEFMAVKAVSVAEHARDNATKTVTYIVAKAADAGDFEFILPAGTVEIRRPGAHLVLAADQPVRFGAVDRTSYEVVVANDKAEQKDGKLVLPAGTRGELKLGKGQALVPLQPILVAPWPYGTPVTLSPTRSAGQRGLANLTIEARQSGTQFNASGFAVGACVRAQGTWRPVGVSELKAHEVGAATIVLAVPTGALPALKAFTTDVELVVASVDGQYRAYGGLTAIGRGWGALIALLVTGALLVWLFRLRHEQLVHVRTERLVAQGETQVTADATVRSEGNWGRWVSGLFVGTDNAPSLSLFQIFVWTVITVWGLAYVFVVTGSLLTLTTEMMVLLGIAGTGSVLARFIGAEGEEPKTQPKYQPFEFWQILSTQGRFDLLKLQLFVFTLMIAVYVIWQVLDTAAFPSLDMNTLLLMGISQGVYIGGKVAGTTAVSRAQTLKLERDVKSAALEQLTSQSKSLKQEEGTLKAKGAAATDAEKARLTDLPGLIKAKEQEVADLTAKLAELKTAYDKALKEAGLSAG
jgi:hypothetical protein